MRLSALSLLVAAVGLVAIPLGPACAVPAGPAIASAGPPPAVIQVWGGCGPGWHPVRGHYDRWGRWIPRHCVPNY